jgi:hypothetical protein
MQPLEVETCRCGRKKLVRAKSRPALKERVEDPVVALLQSSKIGDEHNPTRSTYGSLSTNTGVFHVKPTEVCGVGTNQASAKTLVSPPRPHAVSNRYFNQYQSMFCI